MANIKRNLVYNFLLSCSQVILPLVSIPYVSRVLDPAGIGRVGFIDSFTWYFITIAEFGIMVYGIREVAKLQHDAARLRMLVSELLKLHIISSLVTLVLYVAGIWLVWERVGDSRLVWFSLSFLLVNFFACEWYFMGRERFGYITLRSLLVRLLGLASIFLLVKQPADYYIYYGIMVGAAIASSVWNNIVLFREMGISLRRVNWRRHLPFVTITWLISIFYSIPLMLDNVLLGLVSTAAAVGFYSFSVKVVKIGTQLLTDSFLVFFPRVVALGQENDHLQSQQKLALNLQFVLLLAIPMGAGIYLVADELAIVVFGKQFAGIASNLRVLAFFPLLKGVSLFLSNPILIAHHYEKAFLKNLVAGCVFFIAATLVLGYYYQDEGVCLALVLTELCMVLLNYNTVRKKMPALKVLDMRTILQALLGVVAFVPLVCLVKMNIEGTWLRLTIAIVGCGIAYFLFLYLFVHDGLTGKIKEAFRLTRQNKTV